MKARFLPCGPTATVVEVDGMESALALAAWLRAEHPPGVTDLVPAATTVMVQVDSASRLDDLRLLIASFEPTRAQAVDGRLITIDTVYAGEDLDDVGRQAGLTVEEVIDLHSSTIYTAAFCGFVPGFIYLTGLDERLHLPRRQTPRTRVPPGSVAVAIHFTGVYPVATPGGWNLLGHTDAVMWDARREHPALVEPGDRVQFVPVGR